MDRLFVKCKNCDRPFLAGVQMNRATFNNAQMDGNQYQCPSCRELRTYDKADHFFADV